MIFCRPFVATTLVGAVVCTFSIASLGDGKTTANQPPRSSIHLSFTPAAVVDGMPGGFLFSLTNKSDHDVQLPAPILACTDSINGSVDLSVEFHPLHPGDSIRSGGCTGDHWGEWPSILTRLRNWKTVHPGEAMVLKGERGVFHYSDEKPGTYKFWATYTRPYVKDVDQQLLLGWGIDLPVANLVSTSLTVEKKP